MSERKNINIDIVASCVCRDAFVIGAPAVASNKYDIKSNFQYNSMLSYMSPPNESLSVLTDEDLSFGTPWQKRMLLADFKKDVFDKLYVEDSFIILDITSAAIKHFDISQDKIAFLTSTKVSRPNLPIIENAIGFSPRVIDPWEISEDYINDAVDRYTSKIVSLFPKGKIIFTQVLNASEYINKNGTLSHYANLPEIKKKNDFLKKLEEMICKRLEELGSPAYVVPMPDGVLGYELHKWGKYSLHYCDEYYEYLFRAYDTICSDYSLEEMSEIISELKSTCESRFVAIRERAISKAAALAELEELKATFSAEFEALKAQITDANVRTEKVKKELKAFKIKKQKDDAEFKKQIDTAKKENQKLRNELDGTRASLSFKIGRFVTFVPRKILRKK